MTVPPPTEDDLVDLPFDADLDEAFWRAYAVDVVGLRESWVDDLLAAKGVAGLVEELAPRFDT